MGKTKSIYRTILTKFWSDNKVQEELSPNERYMFLYLLTNEKTNLSGCYELGYRKMSFETGYDIDTCKTIIKRLIECNIIQRDEDTSEILLINWAKNNWEFTSDKYMTGVKNAISEVKSEKFRTILTEILSDGIKEFGRGTSPWGTL